MYRVFERSQVVLSGFQCMYVIHEASLTSCTVTIPIDY